MPKRRCYVPRCHGPAETHAEIHVALSGAGTWKVEVWTHNFDDAFRWNNMLSRMYFGDDKRAAFRRAARAQRKLASDPTGPVFVRTGEML